MYKLSIIDKISFILVIIGAINWGLYGLFNFDIIYFLLGTSLPLAARIMYILVGASGVDMILLLIRWKVINIKKRHD